MDRQGDATPLDPGTVTRVLDDEAPPLTSVARPWASASLGVCTRRGSCSVALRGLCGDRVILATIVVIPAVPERLDGGKRAALRGAYSAGAPPAPRAALPGP